MTNSNNPDLFGSPLFASLTKPTVTHRPDYARWSLLARATVILGVFGHAFFVPIFWYLNLPVLALVQVASTLIFALAYWRISFGKLHFAFYSTLLFEIPASAFISTAYLGTAAGFWIYHVISITVINLVPILTIRIRHTLSAMLFAVFVALGVSGVNYQPIVVLSNEWLTFFFIMNMSYFSLIMVSFFVIYEGAVDKAETELADLNHELEEKVASQVKELERFGRLKRFLSPQVASVIVEGGNESQLESHRAEITVLFADLRGFTNFADQTIPETVMAALNAYHGLAGPLINKYEGTLERFAGDGFMVFFNDPVPCQDPGLRAARLAHDLHSGFDAAISSFSSQDCPLGLGIGIAQGPATLGPVGFEDRLDYAAIGSVTNLASRLCDTARDTQTLISKEVSNAVRGYVEMSKLGEFNFKGLSEEITVFDLTNTNGQAA